MERVCGNCIHFIVEADTDVQDDLGQLNLDLINLITQDLAASSDPDTVAMLNQLKVLASQKSAYGHRYCEGNRLGASTDSICVKPDAFRPQN